MIKRNSFAIEAEKTKRKTRICCKLVDWNDCSDTSVAQWQYRYSNLKNSPSRASSCWHSSQENFSLLLVTSLFHRIFERTNRLTIVYALRPRNYFLIWKLLFPFLPHSFTSSVCLFWLLRTILKSSFAFVRPSLLFYRLMFCHGEWAKCRVWGKQFHSFWTSSLLCRNGNLIVN